MKLFAENKQQCPENPQRITDHPQGLSRDQKNLSFVANNDVFTILTRDFSYCVRRSAAQAVVDALSRREVSIDVATLSGEQNVTVQLRDVVQIIEHRLLNNDRMQLWWSSGNVIDFTRYRETLPV